VAPDAALRAADPHAARIVEEKNDELFARFDEARDDRGIEREEYEQKQRESAQTGDGGARGGRQFGHAAPVPHAKRERHEDERGQREGRRHGAVEAPMAWHEVFSAASREGLGHPFEHDQRTPSASDSERKYSATRR